MKNCQGGGWGCKWGHVRGVGIGVEMCSTFCNLQSLGWEGEAERRASSPSTLHTTGSGGLGKKRAGGGSSSAFLENKEAVGRGTYTNQTESADESLPLSVYLQALSDLIRREKSISYKTPL